MDINAIIKQMLTLSGLDTSEETVEKIKELTGDDEEKVAEAVQRFMKENDPSEMDDATFDKWLKAKGIKDKIDRRVQAEADKRLTKFQKKQQEEKEKPPAGKKEEKKPAEKKETDDPTMEKINSLTDTINKLSETVGAIVNKTKEDERAELVMSLLEENDLPPSVAEFISAENEDEIRKQVDGFKELVAEKEKQQTQNDLKNMSSGFKAGKGKTQDSPLPKSSIRRAAEQRNAERKGESHRGTDIRKKLNLSD